MWLTSSGLCLGLLAGEPGDAITIKSVALKPDPPVPGQELTIYADGTVNNLIDVSTHSSSDPASASGEPRYRRSGIS